jgi:hypothetical protein
MKILDNYIVGFGRRAINTDTSDPGANADGSRYVGNYLHFAHGDCMYFVGHDSNGIVTENNNMVDCGGFGMWEQGVAHNVHINDEVAFSGWNFNGGQNCSTGPSDFTHGAFYEAGGTNHYVNPYAETSCNSVLILNQATYAIWIQGSYGLIQHVYGPSVGPSGGNRIWLLDQWISAPR